MAFQLSSPSQQVADHLRQQICTGIWRHELPGTPMLAAQLGIDRKTVTAAIRILEVNGLLQAQGPGKARKIVLPDKLPPNSLHVRILLFEARDQQQPYCIELQHQLQIAGHSVSVESKSLTDMGMDPERIQAHVERNPADAWLPIAASHAVLDWFASQAVPTMAIFGRRHSVPIAGLGPDRVQAMQQAVRRLIELGHRRIVLLAREERRIPNPGFIERAFLEELEKHGIPTGVYNLPNWEDNPQSFHQCLHRIFSHTPPTALLIDEPQFFVAAQQHLSMRGILCPRDVSMVSMDYDSAFDWCLPTLAHFQFDLTLLVVPIVHWINDVSKGRNNRQKITTPTQFIDGGSIGPVLKYR